MLRVFLKKTFWKNEIVSSVKACIALIDERNFVHKPLKLLCNICIGCEIGFRSDGISSHGPSKGVCQSPSSFFSIWHC